MPEIFMVNNCVSYLKVVTGGHYDVDVIIEAPNRQVLYREVKQQYGQHEFTAETTGTYQVRKKLISPPNMSFIVSDYEN